MITGEIKLYPEPAPYTPPASFAGGQGYHQDDSWKKKFPDELEKAKTLYKVGDLVQLKTNIHTLIRVENFVEKVEDSIQYMGEPCVIIGRNPSYVNAGFVKYSIKELDLDTLVAATDAATQPALVLISGASHDCC